VSASPPEPLGLYVHIPFCEVKCTYCHFAIDPRPGPRREEPMDREERYLGALLAEMNAVSASLPPGPGADTLYFGGGTPSLLARPRLARIVEAARELFALLPGAEITLEANPRDFDLAGYRELRAIGVDRLSLGVQSLDDGVLREMGRLHGAEDARRAVTLARKAGFDNVSVDLILGWPGETRERWRRNLDGIAAMAPEHVSLYVLEIEGKTLLSHEARRGRLHLPDDDLVAALYWETVERLEGHGLERYEISNLARPGRASRHNAKYWADAPFLGFGMSAHSYRDGRRWWNHETFGAYCSAVETGGGAAARAGARDLSPRERAAEALFTGLRRRAGVELAAFRDRYGSDPLVDYASGLRDCFAAGLLERAGTRLRLTDKGVLLSNEVFRVFV
jgi:oxygen-independent coproporphyrinogen-3 oxidase